MPVLRRAGGAVISLTTDVRGYGSPLPRGRLVEITKTKMAGISPGHFHSVNTLPYLGGAVPGGGGGSDAVPPLSSGVMLRTVTRRLMRLGPSVCSLRYCSP